MGAAFLGLLPTELAELVVSHLCLADIRNLRLVNRESKSKASGAGLERYCVTKRVDLRAASLHNAANAIQPGNIGRCLQHLTVTGVIYLDNGLQRIIRREEVPANHNDPMRIQKDGLGNTTSGHCRRATKGDLDNASVQLTSLRNEINLVRQEQDSGQVRQLLIQVFENVKRHGKTKSLQSLKLDVVVYRDMQTRLLPELGAPFRKVQTTAMHTLDVVLQAMGKSAITVRGFDVFSGVRNCSIASCDLTTLPNGLPVNTTRDIKIFSASLSSKLLAIPVDITPAEVLRLENDPDDRDLFRRRSRSRRQGRALTSIIPQDEQAAMVNKISESPGVAVLLQQMITLEELQLEMYNPIDDLISLDDHHSLARQLRGGPLIHHLVHALSPPSSLHAITLRGFATQPRDLLAFLRNIPSLQSLTLHYITLHTDDESPTWSPIFTHLLNKAPKLSYLYLDILFDEHPDAIPRYVHCYTPGMQDSAQFDNFWRRTAPAAGGQHALCLATREEVRRGFGWRTETDYRRGDVQTYMWRAEMWRNFGIGYL